MLTLPRKVTNYQEYFLTGNEYISLPEIDPHGSNILSANVIHLGAKSLLEFRGSPQEPLLKPFLCINHNRLKLEGKLTFSYKHHWLPSFKSRGPGWELEGEIVSPPGYRGCLFILSLTNKGSNLVKATMGWEGTWQGFYQTIFSSRPLKGEHRAYFDDWTGSLILEAYSGLPLAALALSPYEGDISFSTKKQAGEDAITSFTCQKSLAAAPGKKVEAVLFLAVNLEGDGAGTTLVDLKRRGAGKLVQETKNWLIQHTLPVIKPDLEGLLNRNLFFNYFYAAGRALDNDEPVALTSRSPRYYVSAAFWSRDSLLWSFPGLLLVDKKSAKELLLGIYRRHLKQAGEHAHYINGVILYPGFELDQLAAYPLALRSYLLATGDKAILQDKSVKESINAFLIKLKKCHNPLKGLYATFLDPSDDPVTYPFLIYNNILVLCALSWLGSLQKKGLWQGKENILSLARNLQGAIRSHGIVEGPFGKMIAWAVDGRGGCELYDNPPGSLQLAAYYGFCSREEQLFLNTVKWIRSSHNPYFHLGAPFQEAASRHAGHPWPLAGVNDLLALNRGAASFFSRATMDNGFMCETINPHTGQVSTGLAFASAAGFLAGALWYHFSRKNYLQGEKGTPSQSRP